MKVPGRQGAVMLGNVAQISIGSGPAEINRYDRLRNINFEIELNQQPLGEVTADACERTVVVPAGELVRIAHEVVQLALTGGMLGVDVPRRADRHVATRLEEDVAADEPGAVAEQ